jgi:hypothetical protein
MSSSSVVVAVQSSAEGHQRWETSDLTWLADDGVLGMRLRCGRVAMSGWAVGMLRPVMVSGWIRIHRVFGPGAHGPSGTVASALRSQPSVTASAVPVTKALQPRWY